MTSNKLMQMMVGVVIVLAVTTVLVSAATFDRKSGSTTTSGGGATASWAADPGDGTVKSMVKVERNWYDMNVISIGKSQSAVCKNFTPDFTGNAHVRAVMVLNGELRAESKSFGKVPGGVASADVQQLLQIGGKMKQQGIMFVSSVPGMPNSWTANQKEISLESDFAVTKDKVVEVCAGIMTNASLALGGGSANSDFSSDRFAKTYTQEITLSK